MMKNNPTFRHELKYCITTTQRDILMARLDCILEKDKHAKDGIYTIRSLYFDDAVNSAYEEKLMGTACRKKYRIRCYDYSDRIIKLECKNKQGSYIYKEAATLSTEEFQQILNRQFDFLRTRKEDVCKNFYVQCTSNGMSPRVVVDYERVPYVFSLGDVRITFDNDIRESAFFGDLFDMTLPSYYVMEPETLIMEVKYTEFLPDFVRDLLTTYEADYVAASKYVMCCDSRLKRSGILIPT